MTTYSDQDAQRNLTQVLDRAAAEGEVRIRRADGSEYVLRPASDRSALDVKGVLTDLSADEIVNAVRESRVRS